MLYLSFKELFDIVLMTFLLGFLFYDVFRPQAPRRATQDPVAHYLRPRRNKLREFWLSVLAIAPAVILHELAHKFVAIAFGLQATFHAFYANSTTLFLGIIAIIAKLSGFGFVFLVPGFVQIIGSATPLQHAIIAFAGPAVHGLFWLGSLLALRFGKGFSSQTMQVLAVMKYINGFLFILNMLPIPGIDGFAVYSGLFAGLA